MREEKGGRGGCRDWHPTHTQTHLHTHTHTLNLTVAQQQREATLKLFRDCASASASAPPSAAAAAASVYCGVIYVRLVTAVSALRQCTVGGSERKMSQVKPS